MKTLVSLFSSLLLTTVLWSQSLEVVFPNGGEHFINNTWSPHNITWESNGISSFKLEYSINGGIDWILIEDNYTQGNFYSWTTPDIESTECLIRLSESGGAVYDVSDSPFMISSQSIYIAEWTTGMGMFRAELRGDLVPMTAQNFINLTEKGFYTDLIFHRVISGFMIQDGCPYGTGYGDPGYEFDDEFTPLLRHNFPGVLSMANAGPNTNGSQYFITVAPTTWLNDVHSVFGRVIDGMGVVYAISEVATDSNDKPLTDVVLNVEIVDALPALDLYTPYNEMYVETGRTLELEWGSDFVADVKIEFSSDNGSNWTILADSIPADEEHFEWIVPDVLSTECYIRISSLREPEVFDQNSLAFTIRERPVVLNRLEFHENVLPSNENPDNLVMPGSRLKFKINIENISGIELSNAIAYLTSDDASITISKDSVFFDTFSDNDTSWSVDCMEIILPETAPLNGQYEFSLYGSAEGIFGDYWIGDCRIPYIKRFPFLTIDDDNIPDSEGNGNHIAEPGETIELNVKIDNMSDETLYQVFGQLTCENDIISIWNNESGVDGLVYDTASYNNGNPINPNAAGQSPVRDFVFDYTADEAYQFELLFKLTGYINDNPGTGWDNGGVKIKWGIPIMVNSGYPPVDVNQVKNNILFEIFPNPTENFLIVNYYNKEFKNKNVQVTIYDLYGKLIRINHYTILPEFMVISISELKTGMYLLDINGQSLKFIKR